PFRPKTREEFTPAVIKSKYPRVQVSVFKTWAEYISAHSGFYQNKSTLPLELAGVVKKLNAEKSVSAKADGVLLWLAENLTYSRRWLSPGAGWSPRPIGEIVKTKTGDCKDFAVATLVLLKELGIRAEPVYVSLVRSEDPSSILKGPINEKAPIVSDYFNHVVVRYLDGDTWRVIEPGRGLGDSSRPAYFLKDAWALNLGESAGTLYRISLPKSDYAYAKFHSNISPKLDGNFMVRTSVELTGEFSNFFKDIYFGMGNEAFENALKGLANTDAGINVAAKQPISRARGALLVDLEYTLKSRTDKIIKEGFSYSPHFLPFFAWEHQNRPVQFPFIPGESKETVLVKGMFTFKEPKYDCLVRGPFGDIDRRVTNIKEGVQITDFIRFWTPNYFPEDSDDKKLQALHIDSIRECMGSNMALVTLDGKDKTQIPFEKSIDIAKPYQAPESVTGIGLEARLTEIRKLDAYLDARLADPDLLWRKANHVRSLGYHSGKLYIKEHLEEAKKILLSAIEKNPSYPTNFGVLGKHHLLSGESAEALRAFNRGYALSKQDSNVLALGAEISKANKNLDIALRYHALAANFAKTNDERLTQHERQAEILCYFQNKCEEGARVYEEKILKGKPHRWKLHNAALMYQSMKNYKRAIELERKALEDGPWGMAQQVISESRLSLIEAKIESMGRMNQKTDFGPINKELAEMYKEDRHHAGILAMLVRINSIAAMVGQSEDNLALANQYAEELKVVAHENPEGARNAIEHLKTAMSLVRSAPKFGGRTPAAASAPDELGQKGDKRK
ncbi:MAG: hypothetical protein HC883_04055, partial [Bdellovibrionaceae bacterium]|nr:hypothetical protein [Pseudobdellovibrionaceae bacterium]